MTAKLQPSDEDKRLVRDLAMAGIPQEQMCKVVCGGIDRKTLRKHFAHDLDYGKTIANAKVTGFLFDKCSSGDTTAMIFWLKTQCGWKEKVDVDISLTAHEAALKELA